MIALHHCGETYYADEAHRGRRVRCVKCGEVLAIEGDDSSRVIQQKDDKKTRSVTAARLWRGISPVIQHLVTRGRFKAAALTLVGLASLVGLIAILRGHPASDSPPFQPTGFPAATKPTISKSIQSRSLPTGTTIYKSRGPKGIGSLTIDNGTELDGVAKLFLLSSRTVCQAIYVKAGEKTRLTGIGAGTYQLRFSLGQDWDSSRGRFQESASFSQFDDPLAFQEWKDSVEIHYHQMSVTLQPVLGGNVRTHQIDQAAFEEGDPQQY